MYVEYLDKWGGLTPTTTMQEYLIRYWESDESYSNNHQPDRTIRVFQKLEDVKKSVDSLVGEEGSAEIWQRKSRYKKVS